MFELEIYSCDEALNLGIELSKSISAGDIICLNGDLGTGKTVITKGIAKGLNVAEEITSPTFNIVNTYSSGSIVLHHFDVYRIKSIDEMYDIGYEEYFYDDAVCVVEWSNLISDIIPDNARFIEIIKNEKKGVNYRKVKIFGWNNEDISC